MTVTKGTANGTVIKRITIGDGELYADIIARNDGQYQANCFHKGSNDDYNWMSPEISGIYATPESAEAAALEFLNL